MTSSSALWYHLVLALILMNTDVLYGDGDRGPITFTYHGCSYSFVTHPRDTSVCPQLLQQSHGVPVMDERTKSENRAQGDDSIKDLLHKVQVLEKMLATEVNENKKMNKTLSVQMMLSKHNEKKLKHHQRKLSVLYRQSKETKQTLNKQKLFNENIDHKLSNVVLDVEELTRTMENSKLHPQSDVQEKTIPVEAAPEVTNCNVPAGSAEFSDCTDVYQKGHSNSGVYYITPMYSKCPIPVWCDMDTPGGGWLVIQRRINGKVKFERNWEEYRNGFGDVTKELWLGNANIFLLTNQKYYELRVDMWDFGGNKVHAVYKHFKIDGERDWYRLHISNHSGTAPDGLGNHNGIFFSTKDADHDRWPDYHCAREWKGGWWYNNCWFVILNGPYYNSSKVKYRGMSWNDWKPEQLRRVEMKIRPTTY